MMQSASRMVASRFQPVVVGVLVAAFVSACGTSSSASATPDVTTSPTDTAAATLAATAALPTAGPSASAKADPAVGLAIATPYTLASLQPALEAGLEAAMTAAMGSLSSVIEIGARTAEKDGVTQSYVIVMRIPGVPVSSTTFLDGVAVGVAGAEGKIEKQTILGHEVRVVTAPTAVNVTFVVGDRVILIAGAAEPVAIAVATAIIQANP